MPTADWGNDRPSQFTASMVSDHNQAAYNRSIGWNGLTWSQPGGKSIIIAGGAGIAVMSVSITFGVLASVVGLLAAETDRLLFAGFYGIMVFLIVAVLGYVLKGLTLALTGQLFSGCGSGGRAAPEPVAPTVAAAPARPAVRLPPTVFAAIVCGMVRAMVTGHAMAAPLD